MVCLPSIKEIGVASTTVSLKTFIMVIAGIVLIEAAASVVWTYARPGKLKLIGWIRVLEIAWIFWIATWNGELKLIGLSKAGLGQGVQQGIIWSALFGVTALVAYGLLKNIDINPLPWIHVKLPPAGADRWLFFLVAGLISPLAEELCFRGVVYGFFRRWGIAISLVISTGLFVLAHTDARTLPFPQIIGGIVFGWSYARAGSLMTPFIIHSSGNLFLFALSIWIGL